MKLIIDIDENIYHRFISGFANENDAHLIEQLFKNGTPYEDRLQNKWTLVSEGPPDDREWYLAIFQETDTGWVNPLPFICEYTSNTTKFTTQDGWLIRDCTDVDNPIEYCTKLLKCVAWHPLPEPYKKDGCRNYAN
jgi:hypothetical protein